MSPEFFPDDLERPLGMGVDGLFELLGQLIDLELCPEGKMVADFLLPTLGFAVLEEDLGKGDDIAFAAEAEGLAVHPGDFVEGLVLKKICLQGVKVGGHLELVPSEGLVETVTLLFDVEIPDHEEIPVKDLVGVGLRPAVDVIHEPVDFLHSQVFILFSLAVENVDVDNDEVKPPGFERGAVGHAVELKSRMLSGGHGKSDLADQPRALHRPSVIKKGKPLVVAGGVRNQDPVVPRQQPLQAA